MIEVSAPATMMLMGEHAILRGQPCLVAAVNQRLHVKCQWQEHTSAPITLHSSLGHFEGTLSDLSHDTRFKYIAAVLEHFQAQLTSPIRLEVVSDFSSTIGFGSSAAVLVATIASVYQLCHPYSIDEAKLFDLGLNLLHQVQGCGSGADLAAAIYGGVVFYQMTPRILKPIQNINLPLGCIYCGYKTPTPQVVAQVNAWAEQRPDESKQVFDEVGQTVRQGYHALLANDLNTFANTLQTNQKLMETMQVCDPTLDKILAFLKNQTQVYAGKISGSGLGDCVFYLGKLDAWPFNHQDNTIQHIPVQLSQTGVNYHGCA